MADEETTSGVEDLAGINVDEESMTEEELRTLARRRKTEGYVEAYSNFAECGLTPWDVRLLFSIMNEHGLRKVASIVMTPALAKALVGVLSANIKIYEKQNGEIKIPESLVRDRQARLAKRRAEAEVKQSLSQPESSQKPFQERLLEKPTSEDQS